MSWSWYSLGATCVIVFLNCLNEKTETTHTSLTTRSPRIINNTPEGKTFNVIRLFSHKKTNGQSIKRPSGAEVYSLTNGSSVVSLAQFQLIGHTNVHCICFNTIIVSMQYLYYIFTVLYDRTVLYNMATVFIPYVSLNCSIFWDKYKYLILHLLDTIYMSVF